MPAYNPTQNGPRAYLVASGSKTFLVGTRDDTQTPSVTTFENIANGATMAASAAFNQGRSDNRYVAQVLYGSAPTAATLTPQHALVNDDAAFTDIANSTAITQTGGLTQFSTNAPFIRFRVSGVTGSGTYALVLTF